MKHFKKAEFKCGCGCGLDYEYMDDELIYLLDMARGYAEVPFSISSSIRCSKHNLNVGGSKTSSHLTGLAIDIQCILSYNRFRILYGLQKAGFNRFGIAKHFIHTDIDNNKPKQLIWTY